MHFRSSNLLLFKNTDFIPIFKVKTKAKSQEKVVSFILFITLIQESNQSTVAIKLLVSIEK